MCAELKEKGSPSGWTKAGEQVGGVGAAGRRHKSEIKGEVTQSTKDLGVQGTLK